MKSPSFTTSTSSSAPEMTRSPCTREEAHVLVIERKRSTRELMWLVLRSEYRTQTAATYEQGLRRAETHVFDGILMGVNRHTARVGIVALQNLRSIEAYAEVPVLAVSGPDLTTENEQLLDAGFDEVLHMPFARSELLDLLRKHLCKGAGGRGVGGAST